MRCSRSKEGGKRCVRVDVKGEWTKGKVKGRLRGGYRLRKSVLGSS